MDRVRPLASVVLVLATITARPLAIVVLVLATITALDERSALADASSPWTPGPMATGDDTYTGFVDSPADGSTVVAGTPVQLTGWAVDRTASGWSGIDDVAVSLSPTSPALVKGLVGLPRPDVADALGNPFFGASGFNATIPPGALTAGPVVLSIAIHTADKGWWSRQVHLTVQVPPPAPAFSDDPFINVDAPQPADVILQSAQNFTITGFAFDRNSPGAGVGGAGVSRIDIYLDGPIGSGQFLGSPQLGLRNRTATGWGSQFGNAGWQLMIHPVQLTVDAHEIYVYATSAATGARTLTIVPFQLQ